MDSVMSYYLLSTRLEEQLAKGAPSRIVNVASNYAGGLNVNDVNFEKTSYDNNSAYRLSKRADRMLRWVLAEKYKAKGITVNACHPGVINTALLQGLGFGGGGSPSEGAVTPTW